jgi:hypothetical protein
MANKNRTVVETVYHPTKKDSKGNKFVLAALYSDGTILLRHVRFSYPHVGNAYEGENDAGQKTKTYGVVGLMPKDEYKPVMRLLKRLKEEMLAEKKVKAIADDKFYLRDGDKTAKETNEGMYVVSTRETNRPKVRNVKGERMTDPDAIDEMFYGGCFGNMLIRPWWQDHKKYGKRVNCGLTAVQFVRDGERFGEGRIGEDDIDETFEAEDEEEFDSDSGFDDDDDDGL